MSTPLIPRRRHPRLAMAQLTSTASPAVPALRVLGIAVAGTLLAGCTGLPWFNPDPLPTAPTAAGTPTGSPATGGAQPGSPTGSATPPDLKCRALGEREDNDVGRMNQTYHGVDPDDGMVASAAVDAGAGYSVIASRLTNNQVTAWLAWETDARPTGDEVSYALHLAEIKSLTSWDGGPAPRGREALAAALQCVD